MNKRPPREVRESLDWGSAAYHEGGHAIGCHVLGYPIQRAVISFHPNAGDDWTVGGHVNLADTPATLPKDLAIVSLAGPVSEALYRHRIHGEPWQTALKITREYNPSDEAALVRYLRQAKVKERQVLDQTVSLLKQHWKPVTRVATRLMSRHELDGRRIQQLGR